MKRFWVVLSAAILAASAAAQVKQVKQERRPALMDENFAKAQQPQKQPTYQYFSILDGQPMLLELHHDTEVGTGRAVDVYQFVIELQVMNSDGNMEPIGLQISNFYTAHAISPTTAPNPNSAKDCAKWNNIVNQEIKTRPDVPVWPYVEFTVAKGGRLVQTNEDGLVWWSDDIQCWGSEDRFSPF